jgi:hypothetical protein
MTSDHGAVDQLAEKFLESQRHPESAEEIRDVFSALMMERFKPSSDDRIVARSAAGGWGSFKRRSRRHSAATWR